jgi:hypothetical protein
MNTIHAFGDSYVSKTFSGFPGWVDLIVTDMNMNLKNYGIPGASTQYAFKKFMENKKNFVDGDIVIFVFSAVGRVHFEFQNKEPNTAAYYIRMATDDTFYDVIFKNAVPDTSIRKIWYDENKDYIKWYVRNRDLELEKINDTAYRSLLKMESTETPEIKYIILQMNKRDDWTDFKTNNHNFLEIPLALREISDNEFDNTNYLEFIRSTKHDPRTNHMSIKNLRIFNQLIQESLTTGSTKNFTYDQFEQKIFRPIRTTTDYEHYINHEHLYDTNQIRENLT